MAACGRITLVILLMVLAPTLVHAQKPLIIATNIYPPYVNEDVKKSFLPALFDEIGTEMGIEFKIVLMPWLRCEQEVTNLNIWGAIPYTRNAERDQLYLFSDQIYTSDSHFFAYRTPDKAPDKTVPLEYDELTDLRKWRIGGIQGYYYEPLFDKASMDVDYALSENQNFRRLKLGRIDLVPAATTVGWHLIKQLFPPDIAKNFYTLDKPLVDGGTLHLMTSKNYPETQILLKRFNQALTKVKQNGTFARLVEEYGLVMRY
ncbi:ABC transporter substrate-binding protein [Thalassospira alkalitolerans]|uniref:ABC transporter substrate-binding protein n=2 Tax=Thalassospira alkalitolerans TaxID=1293890 RepID=A0A1Y2L9Y0_9PROT|nr:ABC transporter substrate-binding protein [Thalassospira alkalitolerans]|tara:strand:- start:4799 stop:5578 length:780 start_codon:yes stop_codon:yes gene_type:complete